MYGDNLQFLPPTNLFVHYNSAAVTNGFVNVETWNCNGVQQKSYWLTFSTQSNRYYYVSFSTNLIAWVKAVRVIGNGINYTSCWDGSWPQRYFKVTESNL